MVLKLATRDLNMLNMYYLDTILVCTMCHAIIKFREIILCHPQVVNKRFKHRQVIYLDVTSTRDLGPVSI